MEVYENKNLNLLALLPCPIKGAIEEAFINFVEREGIECNYIIDSNANNSISYNEYIKTINDINELPDIVISAGVNNFYGKKFYNDFIKKDYFVDAADYMPSEKLTQIKDPKGNYSFIAMNLLVMVVNLNRLGDLPMPESFEDILHPQFKNKVVIRGEGNSFCETTLLAIYKEYGINGIVALGNSVMDGWHPAQMVKSIGTASKEGPVVSIMPYFYSNTICNKEKIKVVVPKEGAIVSPVTMLVKKSQFAKVEKIAKFFLGEEVGKICVGADFIAFNPSVDNALPNDVSFNWLGWSFINENDIKELVESLNKVFCDSYNVN